MVPGSHARASLCLFSLASPFGFIMCQPKGCSAPGDHWRCRSAGQQWLHLSRFCDKSRVWGTCHWQCHSEGMAQLPPKIQANLPLENQTYLAGQSVNVVPPLAVPKLCFGLESAFLGLSGTVWVGKLGYQHNRVLSALDWHMA